VSSAIRLRVVLLGVDPPIWRQVLVISTITLSVSSRQQPVSYVLSGVSGDVAYVNADVVVGSARVPMLVADLTDHSGAALNSDHDFWGPLREEALSRSLAVNSHLVVCDAGDRVGLVLNGRDLSLAAISEAAIRGLAQAVDWGDLKSDPAKDWLVFTLITEQIGTLMKMSSDVVDVDFEEAVKTESFSAEIQADLRLLRRHAISIKKELSARHGQESVGRGLELLKLAPAAGEVKENVLVTADRT